MINQVTKKAKAKAKQEILKYVSQHETKSGTPTMGGIMMMVAIGVGAIIFGFSGPALIAVLATLGYGLIGFLDDFIKIYKKREHYFGILF